MLLIQHGLSPCDYLHGISSTSIYWAQVLHIVYLAHHSTWSNEVYTVARVTDGIYEDTGGGDGAANFTRLESDYSESDVDEGDLMDEEFDSESDA